MSFVIFTVAVDLLKGSAVPRWTAALLKKKKKTKAMRQTGPELVLRQMAIGQPALRKGAAGLATVRTVASASPLIIPARYFSEAPFEWRR